MEGKTKPTTSNPEKHFKKLYSRKENWNNLLPTAVSNPEYDAGWTEIFLGLEDAFVISKKGYQGKIGSKLIVGETEKSVEVERWNYAKFSINPEQSADSGVILGFSPYVELVEENNVRKIKILKDGIYKLEHKEAFDLTHDDREVYVHIDRTREEEEAVPLAVYHLTGNFQKNYPYYDSDTGQGSAGSQTRQVNISFTLGDMHPLLTGYCCVYAELKKGDELEIIYEGNHTDLNEGNRIDISNQLHSDSNYWWVEYLNFPLDILKSSMYQKFPPS